MGSIKKIKEILRERPYLFRLAKGLYRTVYPAPPEDWSEFELVVRSHFKDRKEIQFVQVGSNDGRQGDPLFRTVLTDTRFKGVFVEPVKYLFDRLVENYGCRKRFSFENVAIGKSTDFTKFYYVSSDAKAAFGAKFPGYVEQLGSFNKELLVENIEQSLVDQGILKYIVEEDVECISLNGLLERNKLRNPDLLHIDTEGFDYEILRQVDFKAYKPGIVLFEHVHLSPSDKISANKILMSNGYTLSETGRDTLAVLAANN